MRKGQALGNAGLVLPKVPGPFGGQALCLTQLGKPLVLGGCEQRESDDVNQAD